LAEPHEIEASWKNCACVLLKPDGLYPARPETEGNKPAKLKAIGAALKRCDQVILATDREGQLIGQEILEDLGYRGTVRRALFSTKSGAAVRPGSHPGFCDIGAKTVSRSPCRVSRPPNRKHSKARDGEGHVPVDPVDLQIGLVDMMEAKYMVVDDALGGVEQAKTEQHRARQKFARPELVTPLGAAPEHEQPCNHEYMCRAVEDPVPKRVELEGFDAVDRIPAAQQVVPLKELVQDDPVEKSRARGRTGCQPFSENDAHSCAWRLVRCRLQAIGFTVAPSH
jgi:hypothetical protein